MMEIRYHKYFIRDFQKLNKKQQDRVHHAIEIFRTNPFDSELNNHALHGKLKGYRSISVGGDLRIIFLERGNYTVVLFLRIGTHSQVY